MKTTYTVKNFKVFDKKGVTIPIAPLTFLVGCNSSGKSSIVKSLTLLKTHFDRNVQQGRKSFMDSFLDFNVKPNESLGKFQKVINDKIRRAKDKVISLEYTIHSYYANDNIRVALSFIEGDLGNAKLSAASIFNSKNELILSIDGDQSIKSCDLSLLKDAFCGYMPARWIANLSPLTDYSAEEREQIESTKQYFESIIGTGYIADVYNHRDNLRNFTFSSKESGAFMKFWESCILNYYSVLDEIGIMSPEEARLQMLEKATGNNSLKKLINKICDDFAQSGEENFMSYYCNLENHFLTESWNSYAFVSKFIFGNDFFPFNIGASDILRGHSIDNGAISIHDADNETLANLPFSFDFSLLYEALARISKGDEYYELRYLPDFDTDIEHPLFRKHFRSFVNWFLEEVLNTDITEGLSYVSSSRVQVRRIYTLEDKNEFSKMVKNYHEAAREFQKLNPPVSLSLMDEDDSNLHTITYPFLPGDFISKWLHAFGIGERFSIDLDNNGVGFLLKVYKSEKDKKGVLLADMGYGITQLFSILLQIEISIMRSLTKKFKPNHLHGAIIHGYYDATLAPATIAIEEPEIHLHPRYQSLLAEMFFEAYKEYNVQFIIETHSEYLLRKIQTIIGSEKLTPEEVSMIYVEETSEVLKGTDKLRRIPIKKDGRLSEPFGPGFYDEADNLSIDLFTNMSK